MTDKSQDTSEFSFRTFDIYRRFVQVLQSQPTYLEEFKTGSPRKETCLALIKSVFQYQQQEEEIKKYLQYFGNHAKMMVGHAEDPPDNWNDAIDYTNRYIQEIRKYLRKKGISVRSDLNSVGTIAEDIGKRMHGTPTVKQIEALKYYLKYDLHNPKRTIIASSTPKKSKNKPDKTSKSFVHDKQRNDQSSQTYESKQETLFLEKNKENHSNNHNEIMEPEQQFECIETEVVDDLFAVTSDMTKSKEDIDDPYSFKDEENVISPESSPSPSYENLSEPEGPSEKVVETLEKNRANLSSTESKEAYEKHSSHNFHLKRKSCSPYEDDQYHSLKKQLQFCRRIPNNYHQMQIKNPTEGQTICISNNCDNSSDSEINVENDDEDEIPINKFLMVNEPEIDNDSKRKVSYHSEISGHIKNSIFNLKSQVRGMSYADAMKHIDLVTTFCELKNIMSQDELCILQQIREKMYLKSLNERT